MTAFLDTYALKLIFAVNLPPRTSLTRYFAIAFPIVLFPFPISPYNTSVDVLTGKPVVSHFSLAKGSQCNGFERSLIV